MVTTHCRKHWLKLYFRILSLYIHQPSKASNLIFKSYDKIAKQYDETWTTHMRYLSLDMINRLSVPKDAKAIDLTCGTGFITGKLAEKTNGVVVGVDASDGMLEVARQNHKNCGFINSDIIKFLKNQKSNSVDVVTCGWGLGYSHPYRVIRQIYRILKPNGLVAIIDNTHDSISEMVGLAISVLAENPKALNYLIKIHFLSNKKDLIKKLKFNRFHIVDSWDGVKEYYAKTGKDAINRVISTGAAAGFEFCLNEKYYSEMYKRYAEVAEEKYGDKIPILHRYIAAIGIKKK